MANVKTYTLTLDAQELHDLIEAAMVCECQAAQIINGLKRKGLDLGGGPARYVVKTDTAGNVVYVSADRGCEALWTRELALGDLCWVSGCVPASGRYLVRTRHTRPFVEAHVEAGDGVARIVFDERVPAVAAGQSVTIYRDEECLGGGIVM